MAQDVEFDTAVIGTEGGRYRMAVDENAIAEIVESLSERWPKEQRLRQLVDSSPLRLSSIGVTWKRILGVTKS